MANYRDTYNGRTKIPLAGTVARRGRLYCVAQVTIGTVVWDDKTTESNAVFGPGYHPGWILSATNASLVDTAFIVTQSNT